MLGLVQIPEVVKHYAPHFRSVFSEANYEHFQRYVSGLLISENKTVEAINRLFVLDPRNQSSLNRFLTQSNYDEDRLNTCRLNLLQSREATAFKTGGKIKGSLSIDDTLLHHLGRQFDQITQLYDSVSKQYVYAHNLVTLHYSDDGIDYPVHYQMWEPVDVTQLESALRKAQVHLKAEKVKLKETDPIAWRRYLILRWGYYQHKRPQLQEAYQSKLIIARRLLDQFVAQYPGVKLPVSFDNWYTQKELCQYIDQTLQLPYVGTLRGKDLLIMTGSAQVSLEQFAQQLKEQHLEDDQAPVFEKTKIPFKGHEETYYTYCRTHRIKHFGRQRLVIRYRKEDLSDDPVFLISNRLTWHASGIVRIYRHRWPVEVYHEESKAEGLDQYQIRDFKAIKRHVALVIVAYSLLQCARHDSELLSRLQQQVRQQLDGSLAFWRRLTQAQAFFILVQWISLALNQGHAIEEVLQPFLKAIAY